MAICQKDLNECTSEVKELFNSQITNIRTLIDANDKNYNQRFENVIQATASALSAADRAVSKAEMASEKRFDAVNEFRATLADQQKTLIPRQEADILIKGLSEKVNLLIDSVAAIRLNDTQFLTVSSYQTRHEELQKQVDDIKILITSYQGRGIGISTSWGFLIGLIGVISAIVAILTRFI